MGKSDFSYIYYRFVTEKTRVLSNIVFVNNQPGKQLDNYVADHIITTKSNFFFFSSKPLVVYFLFSHDSDIVIIFLLFSFFGKPVGCRLSLLRFSCVNKVFIYIHTEEHDRRLLQRERERARPWLISVVARENVFDTFPIRVRVLTGCAVLARRFLCTSPVTVIK